MRIAVIEDNPEVAEFIKDVLEEDPSLQVEVRTTNFTEKPLDGISVVVLDENLNGRSGLEALSELKKRSPTWRGAVIVVTGNDQDQMIKRAFENGVDDYLVKPFKPLVLLGKIKALSSRLGLVGKNMLTVGQIEIETNEHIVRVAGEEINLTLTEYKILQELAQNQGRLVTRDNLKTRVYGDLFVTNRTIDVHICSLRKKLRSSQDLLKTVRGVGYRLDS